jgi:hypothetical protein
LLLSQLVLLGLVRSLLLPLLSLFTRLLGLLLGVFLLLHLLPLVPLLPLFLLLVSLFASLTLPPLSILFLLRFPLLPLPLPFLPLSLPLPLLLPFSLEPLSPLFFLPVLLLLLGLAFRLLRLFALDTVSFPLSLLLSFESGLLGFGEGLFGRLLSRLLGLGGLFGLLLLPEKKSR